MIPSFQTLAEIQSAQVPAAVQTLSCLSYAVSGDLLGSIMVFKRAATGGWSSFTGTILGYDLTVSGVTGTIQVGQPISGAGVAAGTIIKSGSGTAWKVSVPQSVGPVAMTGSVGFSYIRSADRFLPNGTTDATNGGYWVLANNILMPEMFGAKRDGVTDDWLAIQSTIWWLESLLQFSPYVTASMACMFSPGIYACNSYLTSRCGAKYFAPAVTETGDLGSIAVTIKFPNNFAGPYGWLFVDSGGGSNCTIENITLQYGAAGQPIPAPIHGWVIRQTVRMKNCGVYSFPGNGFNISGDNGGGYFNSTFTGTIAGTTLTFPSVTTGVPGPGQVLTGTGVIAGTMILYGSGLSWTVDIPQNIGPVAMNAKTPIGFTDACEFKWCRANRCGYNGFYGYAGGNYQIGVFDTCFASGNNQFGFVDRGLLGNAYWNPDSIANSNSNASPAACVNYNGATYVVTPINNHDFNDFSLTLPSTTAPGTDAPLGSVWTKVALTVLANTLTWTSGVLYQPGGAFWLQNGCMLQRPYVEGFNNYSWLYGPTNDAYLMGPYVSGIMYPARFLDGGFSIEQPNEAIDPLGIYPYEDITQNFGAGHSVSGAGPMVGTTNFWGINGSTSGAFGMMIDYSTYTLYCGKASPFGTAGWAITGGGPTPATFTGTITGTNLTFPSVTSGAVAVGQIVTGAGVTATRILSGSGLSWTVDVSQTVGPVAMTASKGNLNAPTFGASTVSSGQLAVPGIALGYVRTAPSAGMLLGTATMVPAGGARGAGWFSFASGVAVTGNGLLGWQTLTQGTPGTQLPLYGAQIPVYGSSTVAALPAGVTAARAFVTDSTQTLAAGIGTAVVGGGANHTPVYYDSGWKIG